MNLKPLGDRVVVEREEAKENDGRRDRAAGHRQGQAAEGEGRRRRATAGSPRTASAATLQVKVGDVVLFTSYAGDEFKIDGEKKVLADARGRHPRRDRLRRRRDRDPRHDTTVRRPNHPTSNRS